MIEIVRRVIWSYPELVTIFGLSPKEAIVLTFVEYSMVLVLFVFFYKFVWYKDCWDFYTKI